MNIKKILLILLLTSAIENQLFSMKRLREASTAENNANQTTQSSGIDFTNHDNLPYELTKKIIYDTIVSILEDCKTGEDFEDACKKICNLRATNKQTKEIVDNILKAIEARLNAFNFNEQNLDLEYRFVLFFMLKNNEIINKNPYFKNDILDMYAETLSDINLKWDNIAYQSDRGVKDDRSRTALACSIEANHFKIAELLIKMGTNVNIISQNSNALHFIIDAQVNHKTAAYRVAKLLLNTNINVNYGNIEGDNCSICPLIKAIQYDNKIALDLITHPNINLNVKDKLGRFPLFIAAQQGNYNLVKALIERKVNINQKLENQESSLMAAIIHQRTGIVELLIRNQAQLNNTISTLDHNYIVFPQKTKEDHAVSLCLISNKQAYLNYCKQNGINTSQFIQNAQYTGGFTELMLGVLTNNSEIVKLLLNNGAYVHAINDQGETALHMALNNNASLDIIKLLVKSEAFLTGLNYKSVTPLMYAIARCNTETVKYLLSLPSIENDLCVIRNFDFGKNVNKDNLFLLNNFKFSRRIKSFIDNLDIKNLDLEKIKKLIETKILENDLDSTWFLLTLPLNINIADFKDLLENHKLKEFRELLNKQIQQQFSFDNKDISKLFDNLLISAALKGNLYSVEYLLSVPNISIHPDLIKQLKKSLNISIEKKDNLLINIYIEIIDMLNKHKNILTQENEINFFI